MKGLKLAAAILVFITLTFTPKAEAKSLFNTRQVADLQKSFTLFKQEGNQEFAQKATDAIEKIQQS
ncbi:MAG: hypothetical protein V7K67_11575 [Nostoc sp.]|uniref:hypothetical protein n=1 Tax=Nostoc sp. TaxID=1180 RepID=UPI002FFBB6B3